MAVKCKRVFRGDFFDVFNYTLLAVFIISILYPFWNLLVISLNSPRAGSLTGIAVWPRKFTLDNYRYVLNTRFIWTGYRETFIRTFFGTLLTMLVTSCGAYALSKRYLPSRMLWTVIIVIPMFFSGGLIPSYLLNVKLGLIDKRLVLIIPGLVSSFSLIIMRNFFMTIPAELEESARIDGASSIKVLFFIIIPVSKAVIATVSLWTIVGHWNSWFDAMIYMRTPEKMPLQVVLRRILLEGTTQMMDMNPQNDSASGNVTPEVLKAATVYVCVLPIMCVYPFLQKYFVKGVMLGSLKG